MDKVKSNLTIGNSSGILSHFRVKFKWLDYFSVPLVFSLCLSDKFIIILTEITMVEIYYYYQFSLFPFFMFFKVGLNYNIAF
jgi:hypothetical protein